LFLLGVVADAMDLLQNGKHEKMKTAAEVLSS
jgi:hypothetical protein